MALTTYMQTEKNVTMQYYKCDKPICRLVFLSLPDKLTDSLRNFLASVGCGGRELTSNIVTRKFRTATDVPDGSRK